MRTRIEFRDELERRTLCHNLYFQPPESTKINWPCIIYKLSDIVSNQADNEKYKGMRRYEVTVIDPNPDSELVEKILLMPYSKFDRQYSSNNLNHFTFTIYY